MSAVYLSINVTSCQGPRLNIKHTMFLLECTEMGYLDLGRQVFGRLHHEVKTLHHVGWPVLTHNTQNTHKN